MSAMKSVQPTRPTQIVHKVEEGMDPETILCTTYQMRDMYAQLGSGYYTSLDIMNYIQHHAAIKDIRSGDRVLDVCCGRALLLPLLRYYKKDIRHYIGIDIEPANYRPAYVRSGNQKIEGRRFAKNTKGSEEPFYPFAVDFVQGNVAEMSSVLAKNCWIEVDYIVYTASIEHMQRDAGAQSLVECYELLKPGGKMFLSTPNTEGDPYDTQYAAHLYEWSLQELLEVVKSIGFSLQEPGPGVFGLVLKLKDLEERILEYYPDYFPIYELMRSYMPKEWLQAAIAPIMPKIADEVALKLVKPFELVESC